MKYPEEIHNSRLDTTGRTYFFDVKKRYGESKRLVVTQSVLREGARQRERLTIYEEDVAAFLSELMNATAAMGSGAPSHLVVKSQSDRKAPQVDRYAHIRAKYPRAYEPWSEADDQELIGLKAAGATIEQLVERFQRQPSAIQSRLQKLTAGPQ